MSITAYIGLGSNLGNRVRNIKQALEMIAALPGTSLTAVSPLYETSPWGKSDQDDFINAAARVETDLSPRELLQSLLDIEIKLGRQRGEKWGPRKIDLDILLYGLEVVEEEDLRVPHPYMSERLFVLAPLAAIDADLILPDGRNVQDLFNERLTISNDRVIKIE